MLNEPYKGLSAISYNVLNRTDMISFSSSANRYIKYAYSASGTLIRKQQYDNVGGVATLQTTTDYIDGLVFTTAGAGTAALQYFAMPEGRVLNNAGTLSQEFTIADQQGNVRIAFDNTGTGGIAKTRQENSYYTFGMIMPGSMVGTPTNPNKNLYNGGSEWQNDYANLPDYYQTFYRNYDAALGRWIGADPEGESTESMTGYQYAGNNPVMMNDPMGDIAVMGVVQQKAGHEIDNMNLWLNTGGAEGGYGDGLPLNNMPAGGGVGGAVLAKINSIISQQGYLLGKDGVLKDGVNVTSQVSTIDGTRIQYTTTTYNPTTGNMDVVGHAISIPTVRDANQGGPGPQYPRGAVGGPVPWYGNFLGPGPDGPNANPYKLLGYGGKILKPIDMMDAAAQRHDYAYWKLKASGVHSALFEDRVGFADRALAADAYQVAERYAQNMNDLITHKPITSQEYWWAIKVEISFGFLGGLKAIGYLTGTAK